MANYNQRGHPSDRRGRGTFSRGAARGRGGRVTGPGAGPRLPSVLSDELGLARQPKKFRDDTIPTRGRGHGSNGGATRGTHRPRPDPPAHNDGKKRKRPASPPVMDDPESDVPAAAVAPKKKTVIIEKGSGFRTKVSSDALTPLARMLAAQGGNPASDSDASDEEPIKKRKTTTKKPPNQPSNDVVDISIMGGAFSASGGKKTQAELEEDAEIAWLEYQLRKGKGKARAEDDELGDDGLDGALPPTCCVPPGD